MAMWPGATGGVGGGWPGITLIRGEGRARLSGVGAAKKKKKTGLEVLFLHYEQYFVLLMVVSAN